MYRKIVWCYVLILTLLDISLNNKLSAQGKSHGVTVHDSLIEGITFQEWGKEAADEGPGAGGRPMAPGALQLWPPTLEFGSVPLASPKTLAVTLTNTANTTMHLASVAGTTPDFHASFFHSKSLPPQCNTTFSVVYLGRHEGHVAAHLYIHTSLGAHKYPVSAVGVASAWGVWPLVGVRVPLNASVEPLLTLHNPTERAVQVTEVYSSGAWLGLQLPGGGAGAPRAAWTVPPHSSAPLVRLQLRPHHHHHHHQHHHQHQHQHQHPLTAYVRIKGNMTGGGLVVCVEALAAPPGEYAAPLHLRLRTRGSEDPPDLVEVSAGNSGNSGVSLEARVWGARCAPAPHSPPPPDLATLNGNGVKYDGVKVSLERDFLEPHQRLTRAAQLTFDYASMWAGYSAGGAGGAGGEGGEGSGEVGAWCGGWVTVGRSALPYSVRVVPGTLRLHPAELHFVTSLVEEAGGVREVREVRVHNEFPVAVHVARIDLPAHLHHYFKVEVVAPQVVRGGESAVVARVWARQEAPAPSLHSQLVVRTNLTEYALPLLVYGGQLHVEWAWPRSADGTLRLGTLGASSTRHVRARLHNADVLPLCVHELRVVLPGARLALDHPHTKRCVEGGGWVDAWLTAVAPARAGAYRGHVVVRAAPPHPHPHPHLAHAPAPPPTTHHVTLTVHHGRVHAHPVALPNAAPYAWASAPLTLESTMELTMRVESVSLPPDNPAVSFQALSAGGGGGGGEVSAGRHAVGSVVYAPEKLCEPHCYTGLDVHTAEGVSWAGRAATPSAAGLREDAALQAARHAHFARPLPTNISLHLHTDHVVQIPVTGTASAWWPRLAASPGDAGLAGVGSALPLRVRVRNPSRSHALLLQPVVGGPLAALVGTAESSLCRAEACSYSAEAFRLVEWRETRGAVRVWREVAAPPLNSTNALPLLLLAPDAEIELKLTFAPKEPAALTSYLYLRNNLTIMEGVQLSGRGAYPSFEIGGRRPGTTSPLLFEVSECGASGGGGAGGGGGVVSVRVSVRNTGRVGVRLREWRVSGAWCASRGFQVAGCAPLSLAPNESRALTLLFAPDWTLARVTATLSLRTDTGRAAFPLSASVPAPLLARCAAAAPRPPWEPALRAAGTLLALAALALVLAAGAVDAERELRRARAARPPPAPRQPLDLRALAHDTQTAAPPVVRRAVGRRRRAARAADPPDHGAERRAFERWRRDVLHTAHTHHDDGDRSSEDNEPAPTDHCAPTDTAPTPPPPEQPSAATDEYDADPETEERPPGSGDEDAASTGSGSASASSSPTAEVDEPDDVDDCEPPPRAASAAPSPPGTPRASRSPPADGVARALRQRRDPPGTPRRTAANGSSERGEARPRLAVAKPHARKDKACRRRERPAASPPRSPAPAPEPRAPLRWGESWSSVVAARPAPTPPAPAPLAPIGSDVRRRAEPAPPTMAAPAPAPCDHSLFYFNGDPAHAPPRTDTDFTWRPPPAPAPALDRPTFSPPRDFLEEPGAVGSGSFRAARSVWGAAPEGRGAAAAWLWGGLGADSVRPPPGFSAARPVRPYDPFHSLASIWAPGARGWRADSPPPSPPPH